MKDYFYILGLDSSASIEEIRSQHRKLSKKFHPDLNPGDGYSERMFKDIQEAYECLHDSRKRSRYQAEYSAWIHSRQDNFSSEQETARSQTAHHRSVALINKAQKIYLGISVLIIAGVSASLLFTEPGSGKRDAGDFFIAPAACIFLYVYFLPTIIAWYKHSDYRKEVFIMNIFVGFLPPPLLFWVVLLIFSLGNISFVNALVLLVIGLFASNMHDKDKR